MVSSFSNSVSLLTISSNSLSNDTIRYSSFPMYSPNFWICFSFATNSFAKKSTSSLPLYYRITLNKLSSPSPNLLYSSAILIFYLFLWIKELTLVFAKGTLSVMMSTFPSFVIIPLFLNSSLMRSKWTSLECFIYSPKNDRVPTP